MLLSKGLLLNSIFQTNIHYLRNLGLLQVVEMSQRVDTGGTGANDQEETTASESSTQVKNLVVNAVKECLADITAGNTAAANNTVH